MTITARPRVSLALAVVLLIFPMACPSQAQVMVARRGWHIDIGFAVHDLGSRLEFVGAALPNARYIFFGFGDLRYLQSRKHGSSSLAAALWPGRALLLATGLENPPQQAFGKGHVVELTLAESQMNAVQAYIASSFVAASDFSPGPYPDSAYSLASGRYSALHTCNTWAAEVLHAGQPRVHHVGVIFAGQLWPQVRRLSRSVGSTHRQGGFVPS